MKKILLISLSMTFITTPLVAMRTRPQAWDILVPETPSGSEDERILVPASPEQADINQIIQSEPISLRSSYEEPRVRMTKRKMPLSKKTVEKLSKKSSAIDPKKNSGNRRTIFKKSKKED